MSQVESLIKIANHYFYSGDLMKSLYYYLKFENDNKELKKYISLNKKIVIERIKKKSCQKKSYSIIVDNEQCIDPLISIIIPVFNSSLYLKKCIFSLLKQSFRKIELICVDDGSHDDSLNILIEMSCLDNRIKVVSQKNKYAGEARNVGIDLARGKYLMFLDSDDFFEIDLCERLFHEAESNNSDIVVCDMRLHDEKTGKVSEPNWSLKTSLLPNGSLFKPKDAADVIFNFTNNWVWNKIFRADLIKSNNIKFQKIRHTNDLYFMCMTLVLAERVGIIKDRLINYRTNVKKSLTSLNTRNESYYDVIECFTELKKSLEKINCFSKYNKSFVNLCVTQIYWNFSKISDDEIKSKFICALFENNFFGIPLDCDPELFLEKSTYSQYLDIISKFSNEQNIYLKIKNSAHRFKVISFDIFDTLVFRPYLKPKDLFSEIEVACDLNGFCEARVSAEKKARNLRGNSEITIDDIYNEIPEQFRFVKEIEVKKEIEVVFSNDVFVRLLEDLIDNGKEVVLTSDMYLEESTIKLILEKCNIKKYKKLYLSSALGLTKKTGDLFKYIIRDYGIVPSELVHVGDNHYSDFEVPKGLGVCAYKYEQTTWASDFQFELSLKNKKDKIIVDTLHQLSRCSIINHRDDFWFRVGYNFAGPLALSFAAEIKREAERLNIETILFIARDGYLTKEIFSYISGGEVPIYYVYASRGLIKNIMDGNMSSDEYIKYIDELIENSLVGKKVLVVDTTTINFTAQRFLKNILKGVDIHGFYWLANSEIKDLNYSSIFTRPSSVEKINFFIETLLSAPTPPVNYIRDGEPIYEEPSAQERIRCEIYESISRGALSFAKQICNNKYYKDLSLPINPEYVFQIIFNYINRISYEDYVKFSMITHTGDVYNKEGKSLSYYLSKFRRPLISIIVCVYNGDEYLEECLNSLKNQSLRDIEVICVDDCSSDKSNEILRDFCKTDVRFKYLRNDKNIGLASSRNKAIMIANGEYIQFVDADDYILENTCESLFERCKRLNLDMLSFSGFNFDENRKESVNNYWSFSYLPSDWNKTWFTFTDCINFAPRMAVSSCLTIYKRSFIERWKINFPDGLYFEDNLFFCKALVKAARISIHKGKFYARRIHSESITQNWNKHFSDYIKISNLVMDFLISQNIEKKVILLYKENFCKVMNYYYGSFDKFYKEKYEKEILMFKEKYRSL